MTFGKPKQTVEPVRCANCGEKYPDGAVKLIHAGRTERGDFWNEKCPQCGRMNCMRKEFADMSDEEFREKQHQIARIKHNNRKSI